MLFTILDPVEREFGFLNWVFCCPKMGREKVDDEECNDYFGSIGTGVLVCS